MLYNHNKHKLKKLRKKEKQFYIKKEKNKIKESENTFFRKKKVKNHCKSIQRKEEVS